MKLLHSASDVEEELRRLLKSCLSCQIAVAWASVGFGFFELLKKHESKIARMVVGTHFFQTHPSFIEAFMAHEHVTFVKDTSGVFHPKAYFFSMNDDDWECVIGSSNLTSGGLGNNQEMAMLISRADEGANEFCETFTATFDAYQGTSSSFEERELEAYRDAWKRRQPLLKRLRGKFGDPEEDDRDDKGKPPLAVPLLRMIWDDYFKEVNSEKDHHTMHGRLNVIQGVRTLFAEHVRFSEIDLIGRQKIAGLIDDKDDGVNYLWFGSMQGAGKFWKAINDNDGHLSAALDRIPSSGPVSRETYLAYIEEYVKAFPEGRHGLGTASRLLAMKRPDVFVCLDARNEVGLRKAFGISRNVGYEAYWDSIIERIMDSTWWNSPRPAADDEAAVWDGRAAFLDSLYYDGKGLAD